MAKERFLIVLNISKRLYNTSVCITLALVTSSGTGRVVRTIFHLCRGYQETENLIWIWIALTISTPLVVYFYFPFPWSPFSIYLSLSGQWHFREPKCPPRPVRNSQSFFIHLFPWTWVYMTRATTERLLAPGLSAQREVTLAFRGRSLRTCRWPRVAKEFIGSFLFLEVLIRWLKVH